MSDGRPINKSRLKREFFPCSPDELFDRCSEYRGVDISYLDKEQSVEQLSKERR